MVEVSDGDFEKNVIEKSKEKPVVVDFWAPWCGPCQMLNPVMEKLTEEYKDKMDIVKLNIEDNQATASKYGVMSIPVVKMFKDGEVVAEFVGAKPEGDVRNWVEENL